MQKYLIYFSFFYNEFMKRYLQEKHHYSEYEIQQLEYFFKTFFSEISKMILFGILFFPVIDRYGIAILFMWVCRSLLGGIHFKTYLGCLSGSFLYLLFVLALSHFIYPDKFLQTSFILLCIVLILYIGPVVSVYRKPPGKTKIRKIKLLFSVFMLSYCFSMWLFPEHIYFNVGFWSVVVHSLQLMIAKIQRKEMCYESRTTQDDS